MRQTKNNFEELFSNEVRGHTLSKLHPLPIFQHRQNSVPSPLKCFERIVYSLAPAIVAGVVTLGCVMQQIIRALRAR